MALLDTWFGTSNTCRSVWSNGVRQNRKANYEHDEGCVEEEFRLAGVKFDRNGEGGREALSMLIVVSTFKMDQNWN